MAAAIPTTGVPGIDYLPNNAAEALAEAPVMAGPCRACPAIAGTKAACDPVTRPIFDQCVAARCAFWCHLTIEGGFATHLCGGWAANRKRTGGCPTTQRPASLVLRRSPREASGCRCRRARILNSVSQCRSMSIRAPGVKNGVSHWTP